MKILTKGKWLWSRTISSTVIGQGLDTVIFITCAFWGASFFTPMMILYHWAAKVTIEIVATPFTYLAVNSLKKSEGVDTYDTNTNFNPFVFRGKSVGK
jgi:hypothetical protein